MDKELMEQFQLIIQGMADMETRLRGEISGVETRLRGEISGVETRLRGEMSDMRGEMSGIETNLRAEMRDSELRTRTFIENQVNKRIDSLFDGYKLTHEKQWELERDTTALKEQVSDLTERLSLLEKKVSA